MTAPKSTTPTKFSIGDHTRTHGMSATRTYHIWQDMKKRCHNPKNRSYKYYGRRGVSVCDRWLASFENFYEDVGEIPHNLTLDRINNEGNYEPGNVRFSTVKEQTLNRRSNVVIEYGGQSMTISEWAEVTGINYFTLRNRLGRLGWTVDRAMTTPVR